MLMAITLALLGWAVQCRLLVLLNFVFRKVGYDKLPHPLLFQFFNTMAGTFVLMNWSHYYNFETHWLYYNTTSLLLGSSYDQIKVVGGVCQVRLVIKMNYTLLFYQIKP